MTRADPLILLLGPHDVTTRAAACRVALLLADAAVTLVPQPLTGSDVASFEGAGTKSPEYLALLEKWRWTAPLWSEGLLLPDVYGETVLEEARAVCDRLLASPTHPRLRSLLDASIFSDGDAYLSALSLDLARGGGDPAISIPIGAGLEEFGARNRLPVVRDEPKSVSARLERQSMRIDARIAVPVPPRTDGELILQCRDTMRSELGIVREWLLGVLSGSRRTEGGVSQPVRNACHEVEAWIRDRERGRPADWFSMAIGWAPSSTTLDASERAAGLIVGGSGASPPSDTNALAGPAAPIIWVRKSSARPG